MKIRVYELCRIKNLISDRVDQGSLKKFISHVCVVQISEFTRYKWCFFALNTRKFGSISYTDYQTENDTGLSGNAHETDVALQNCISIS